jgi:hypothetical protein
MKVFRNFRGHIKDQFSVLFSHLNVPFYSSAAPTVYIEIEADLLCPAASGFDRARLIVKK